MEKGLGAVIWGEPIFVHEELDPGGRTETYLGAKLPKAAFQQSGNKYRMSHHAGKLGVSHVCPLPVCMDLNGANFMGKRDFGRRK